MPENGEPTESEKWVYAFIGAGCLIFIFTLLVVSLVRLFQLSVPVLNFIGEQINRWYTVHPKSFFIATGVIAFLVFVTCAVS